jgi:hypothetical protein
MVFRRIRRTTVARRESVFAHSGKVGDPEWEDKTVGNFSKDGTKEQ